MRYLLLLTLLTPLISFAQSAADREGFVPLVGVPFLDSSATTLPNYADALYFAAISLGAVIAVLKIIFAGVKYMLSDVVTDKSSAKADIKGALLGLIIMIGAVLLLNTINPQITSISTLRLQGVSVPIAEPTEPTITTSPAGVLTIDRDGASPADLAAFETDCLRDTNGDGFPDGQVVRFFDRIECQARPNDDAVVNTDEQFDRLLEASPNWEAETAGLSAAEIAALRQQELEMWREFISAYEAPEGTYDLENIRTEVGAEEVLFVVRDPMSTPGLDPTGVMDQYVARCEYYTGTDNLVEVDGVWACVR